MLQKALCTGHLPIVQYIVEIGANIEAKDQNIVSLTSFLIAFVEPASTDEPFPIYIPT